MAIFVKFTPHYLTREILDITSEWEYRVRVFLW
jgi:hypothetical protein